MRTLTLSELTLASDGAELPPPAALCMRPDGLGWTAIYSPSLTAAAPPPPSGLWPLRHDASAGLDPAQLRESLLDMAAQGLGTTTTGT